MLNLFRQGGLIKALMGAIVILIMAAFAFDYRSKGGGAKDECVVRVDESCVDLKDLNLLTRLVGAPGLSSKQLKKAGFTQYAVNALVERELLLKEGRRLGVEVSEQDIDDQLTLGRVHFSWPVDAPVPQAVFQGMPFPKTGANETLTYIRVRNSKTDAFDFNVYRRQVQNLLRMSPKEFKAQQKTEMMAARVRQMVTAPVRVSEDEAFFVFEQQRSKVTARFAEARYEWFERFATSIDDAAVAAYQESNAAEVSADYDKVKAQWVPGCPVVQELVFNYPPDADSDQRATKAAAATAAAEQLAKGVSFDRVARTQSEGAEASLGGRLGCLNKDANPVAADLLKTIDLLADGAVSGVVETPRGVHVLKRVATVTADNAEGLARAYVARKLATQAKAKELAQAFVTQVITDVQYGKGLNEAIEARRKEAVAGKPEEADPLLQAALDSVDVPKMDISRPVSRGTPVVAGLKDNAATNLLFSLAADALLPAPQETHLGLVVIQLKEKDLATRETFAEDKDELMRGLADQKRAVILTDYIERLKTQAKRLEIDPRYLGTSTQEESEPGSDKNG